MEGSLGVSRSGADTMLQERSVGETLRDWVAAHAYVDLGLQVVALALVLLVVLFAVTGAVYWFLWLVRLSRVDNARRFIDKEIPGLRRGKAAGLEFEFGAIALAEKDTLRVMGLTVEELSFRLAGVEAAVKKIEGAFERFEDVSGRA